MEDLVLVIDDLSTNFTTFHGAESLAISDPTHTIHEYYYYSDDNTPTTNNNAITTSIDPIGGVIFNITFSGKSCGYVCNHMSDCNPTIRLVRGYVYYFVIDAAGHPFWITTNGSNDPIVPYNPVEKNGVDRGTIIFPVPFNAPDTLYYNCQYHKPMTGTIIISDFGPAGCQSSSSSTFDNTSSNTFLSIYSVENQEVLQNSAVVFNTNASMFGDCIHIPNSSDIFIWKPGFYHISVTLYHVEGCQFSFYKNNSVIIPGSTMGSLTGDSQISTTFILQLTDDDMSIPSMFSPTGVSCKLELINNTSFVPFVTLYDSSNLGYSIPQINSTITIFLLHS
jgi:hypothetical protein